LDEPIGSFVLAGDALPGSWLFQHNLRFAAFPRPYTTLGLNLQRASSGFRWIQFKYDSHYRMTGAQENNGREFVYRYNTDGCLEEVEDADHHIAKYGHEGARCPTSMAIDGRPVWSAQFDESDRWRTQEPSDSHTL